MTIQQAETVSVTMTLRDARFVVEHLRFLAEHDDSRAVDHAKARLSARWVAARIEQSLPTELTTNGDEQ